MTTNVERIWTCKVGGPADDPGPGSDGPMRRAVQEAFLGLTGAQPQFTFSGWGGKLDDGERAVVENREPTAEERRLWFVREAAPELLEAAKALLSIVEYALGRLNETEDAEDEIAAARRAIAKAEGRS